MSGQHSFLPFTLLLKALLYNKMTQAVLLSLNPLALLFHTVLEWSDDQYALLRRVRAKRQAFFQDIQALRRYMVFDHWDHLMDFMIQGLELESQFDTS